MRKAFLLFLICIFFVSGILELVGAELRSFDGRYSTTGRFASSYQYQPSFQTYYGGKVAEYWPILGEEEQKQCQARQDLLIQMAPAGCQPAVVRSDLLEEQNVPVFCQLDAFKLNPLIDISEINDIGFQSTYPPEVIGAGFHPARAALRTQDKLLGSPLISNIGYAVVVLKKQANESSMPSFVNVTLSAKVGYESGNALGIGRSEFLLTPKDSPNAVSERIRQSFWQGRYSVELDKADPNTAVVSIYRGDVKVATGRTEAGKMSEKIYLPGSYCRAGLQVAYDGFKKVAPKARLEVGDSNGLDVVDVYKGSEILDGRCQIIGLEIDANDEKNKKKDNKKESAEDDGVITGRVTIRCGYREEITLELKKKIIDETKEDAKNNEEKNRAYREAIEAYEKVADDYKAERMKEIPEGSSITDIFYGEQALVGAIELAKDFNPKEEERLINKMLVFYPKTSRAKGYEERLENLRIYDTSNSSGVVYLDGKYRTIRLTELEDPIYGSSADVYLDDDRAVKKYFLKKSYELADGKNNILGEVAVDELEPDRMTLSVICKKKDKDGKIVDDDRKTLEIDRGETKEACNKRIRLDRVDIREIAKIRLVPFAAGTDSIVNVTIGIGIEKRAIKLNPDKAKEKIENLNKSIKKLEGITNTLGKAVTTLKSACFATAGILTAKTFLTGLKGEGIARQQAMRGEFGWTEECKSLVDNKMPGSSGKIYSSLEECFLGESDKINKDVKAQADAIKKVNENIRAIESDDKTKGGLLGETSVNTQKAAKEYADYLRKNYGEEYVGETKVKELISEECFKNSECDYTTLRNIEQSLLSKRAGVSENMRKNIDSSLKEYETLINNNKERVRNEADEEKIRALGLGASTELSGGQRNIIADVKKADKIKEGELLDALRNPDTGEKKNINAVTRFDVNAYNQKGVSFKGGSYAAGLEKVTGEERYQVVSVAKINKDGTIEKIKGDEIEKFVSAYKIGAITSKESVSYNNKYKNPEVRYYDNAPYKGLPALVPIDANEGWYAGTKQTLPAFGGIAGFESSGRVNSFWLCNVGVNGREQFQESGFGDDICQLINLDTGQPLGAFPGIEEGKARELVGKAVRALTDAANQYGNKPVIILGKTYTDVKSAPNIPAVQCQDFMDPKDCNILFNVCDPVICPASRCDFGGKYQVDDVIQSGIIGSTLLCLPNIKEKIAIPICLTGVHAGLDSYTTILKSHRDCLQENIGSGKTVGICDQITSVYMCEFFWRQGAPLAKILLPKLLEIAYGGGSTRGGGEYMTVSAAWNNAQQSLNFFTQHYAVNSLKAYRIRSVEEAGSSVCKAFVSAKVPTKFKSLVEPDSPPQFYSWFSAIRYSDASVPATSQYKVFYHIFAGKDSGVYYRVYLKNPPETGYYYASQMVQVASGFLPKGEYKTETKDFTAPEGYKELCVDINGEEKCGFKQISSDAAINYIRDEVVRKEIEKGDIKSEKECVSGSPSLNGALGAVLTNTNPEAAAEEAAIPEVYNRGIVRICASQNPGSATNPGRYQDVGSCGNEKVRCWIDRESTRKAITLGNNVTLAEAEKNLDLMNRKLNVLDTREASANLRVIGSKVSDLDKRVRISKLDTGVVRAEATKIKEEIEKLFGIDNEKLIINPHKAEVLLRKAQIEGAIAISYSNQEAVKSAGIKDVKKEDAPLKAEKEVILKDSNGGYEPEKNYAIEVNDVETDLHVEGTRVLFMESGSSDGNTIGYVNDKKITLLESVKGNLGEYYELVHNTEIRQINPGEDYRLVKISSGSSGAGGQGIGTGGNPPEANLIRYSFAELESEYYQSMKWNDFPPNLRIVGNKGIYGGIISAGFEEIYFSNLQGPKTITLSGGRRGIINSINRGPMGLYEEELRAYSSVSVTNPGGTSEEFLINFDGQIYKESDESAIEKTKEPERKYAGKIIPSKTGGIYIMSFEISKSSEGYKKASEDDRKILDKLSRVYKSQSWESIPKSIGFTDSDGKYEFQQIDIKPKASRKSITYSLYYNDKFTPIKIVLVDVIGTLYSGEVYVESPEYKKSYRKISVNEEYHKEIVREVKEWRNSILKKPVTLKYHPMNSDDSKAMESERFCAKSEGSGAGEHLVVNIDEALPDSARECSDGGSRGVAGTSGGEVVILKDVNADSDIYSPQGIYAIYINGEEMNYRIEKGNVVIRTKDISQYVTQIGDVNNEKRVRLFSNFKEDLKEHFELIDGAKIESVDGEIRLVK